MVATGAWLRLPLAFALAVIISAALYWCLAQLIRAPSDQSELVQATHIEFTRMRKDTVVESKREEMRKAAREQLTQVPLAPPMALASSTAVAVAPVQMVQPHIETSSVKMNLSAGGSDHNVTPLVQVKPIFPPRALDRGIEGWVQLRYTITAAGTVKDLVVVDADPKGVFDEAATKAVLRYRYNPRVENGAAVEQRGVQLVIRFKLEN